MFPSSKGRHRQNTAVGGTAHHSGSSSTKKSSLDNSTHSTHSSNSTHQTSGHNSGKFSSNSGEERSVKISPQRLQALLDYFTAYFHHPSAITNSSVIEFNLCEVETLILNPQLVEPSQEQRVTSELLDQFDKMLRMARINHEEWFDFASSRNPDTTHRYQFTLKHFLEEIMKLHNDLQQNCPYEELDIQILFDQIVNADANSIQTDLMTFDALDTAFKTHHQQMSRFRKINSVLGQVKELGSFLKKTQTRLSPRLQDSTKDNRNINMTIHELEKLLIDTLKKLEQHVKENGPISIEMSTVSYDSHHHGGDSLRLNPSVVSRNSSIDSSDNEPAPKMKRGSFSFRGSQPSFLASLTGSNKGSNNHQNSFTAGLAKSISTSFRKVTPNGDDEVLDDDLDKNEPPPPTSLVRRMSFSLLNMKADSTSPTTSKKNSIKSKPVTKSAKKQAPQNYDKRLYDSMSAEERQLVSKFMTNMMEEDGDDDEESEDGEQGADVIPEDEEDPDNQSGGMDRRGLMAKSSQPSTFSLFGGNNGTRLERLSSWRVPSWNGAKSTEETTEDDKIAPGQTSVKKHPVKRSRDTESGGNLIVLLSRQVNRASFASRS